MVLEVNELKPLTAYGGGTDAPRVAGQQCYQRHTFKFATKRDYDRAKASNASHGHNFNSMVRHKHQHFLGYHGHDHLDFQELLSMRGYFSYNDTARELSLMHEVPGNCGCDASGRQINPTIKASFPWVRTAVGAAVFLSIRFGVPVLFAVFAPQWITVGNTLAACLAAGVTGALVVHWAHKPWWQILGGGLVSCLTAGLGTHYWKSVATWGASNVRFIIDLVKGKDAFGMGDAVKQAFEGLGRL